MKLISDRAVQNNGQACAGTAAEVCTSPRPGIDRDSTLVKNFAMLSLMYGDPLWCTLPAAWFVAKVFRYGTRASSAEEIWRRYVYMAAVLVATCILAFHNTAGILYATREGYFLFKIVCDQPRRSQRIRRSLGALG